MGCGMRPALCRALRPSRRRLALAPHAPGRASPRHPSRIGGLMTFRRILLVFLLPLVLLTATFTFVVSRMNRNLPDARDTARAEETEAGDIAYEALQYADAERSYRHALLLSRDEKDDPMETALSLRNLANAVAAQGKHAEAEVLLLEAVTLGERARGSKSV